MDSIQSLWHCADEHQWKLALDDYWTPIKPGNLALERELNNLDVEGIRHLDARGWHDFLRHKYFPWKYTAANRLATTTRSFGFYENCGRLDDLFRIKEKLFFLNKNNIRDALHLAQQIKGLGTAGASGLLAVLFPQHFGTVDQFAVKALGNIDSLPERERIRKMKPDSLTLEDGVVLINVMRSKAEENNRAFQTDFWSPRKIDMVLWSFGR